MLRLQHAVVNYCMQYFPKNYSVCVLVTLKLHNPTIVECKVGILSLAQNAEQK